MEGCFENKESRSWDPDCDPAKFLRDEVPADDTARDVFLPSGIH